MFSSLAKLSKSDQKTIKAIIFNFFSLGLSAILIGSFLPAMREQYGLSYAFSGVLVSVYNAGNILIGLFTGILAIAFGRKRSYFVLTIVLAVGFAAMLVTRNPILLIISFIGVGVARGSAVNYGNGVVTEFSKEDASLLNMVNGMFALGALLAPFILLVCSSTGSQGWKLSIALVVVLGIISSVAIGRVKLDDDSQTDGGKIDFGFMKNRLFWLTVVFSFCYMSTEASVVGWMVSFFNESGVIDESFSLILNGILWASILLGRFACSGLSAKINAPKMLTMLSIGMLTFFTLLMLSHSLIPMIICTIGFGLSVSGMYATAIANTGDVCRKYPFAMGFYTTFAGIGGIITPAIIGKLADAYGVKSSIMLLFIPLALQLVFVAVNLIKYKSLTAQSN